MRLCTESPKEMENTNQDFNAIVEAYKETMYTICLMYARDQDEANDMMQEALINLWRAHDSFRGEASLRSWVWRICVNTCVSYERGQRRHHNTLPISVADLMTAQTDDDQQIRLLHDRIHRLRPFDRALVLLWLEELSYQEIGEILGITAQNVGIRLFRIKEQLRRMSNPNTDQ